jgi:hypothetical protein
MKARRAQILRQARIFCEDHTAKGANYLEEASDETVVSLSGRAKVLETNDSDEETDCRKSLRQRIGPSNYSQY